MVAEGSRGCLRGCAVRGAGGEEEQVWESVEVGTATVGMEIQTVDSKFSQFVHALAGIIEVGSSLRGLSRC